MAEAPAARRRRLAEPLGCQGQGGGSGGRDSCVKRLIARLGAALPAAAFKLSVRRGSSGNRHSFVTNVVLRLEVCARASAGRAGQLMLAWTPLVPAGQWC